MKNMLLAATAFVAITCPAFAMEEAQELKPATITIVANLDKTKSRPLEKDRDGYSAGHFSYYGMPKGYTYDHSNHTVSFKIPSPSESEMYDFSISYTPVTTWKSENETWYTHTFFADLPFSNEDRTVEAILLEITRNDPPFGGGACRPPRTTNVVYKR